MITTWVGRAVCVKRECNRQTTRPRREAPGGGVRGRVRPANGERQHPISTKALEPWGDIVNPWLDSAGRAPFPALGLRLLPERSAGTCRGSR